MRMPGSWRFLARLAAVVAGLGSTGCATMFPPPVVTNPLTIPSSDFETVWMACVTSLDDYFDIATENRLQRKIVTEPKVAATIFEPWYGDSVGFNERFEATLQTIRRFAIITVNPTATGTYAVSIEVRKELEDLVRPERQYATRSVFNNDFPVNRAREQVGPVPLPNTYIDRGRDPKLEQVILAKIKEKLFL
jgi:hypothetical protein